MESFEGACSLACYTNGFCGASANELDQLRFAILHVVVEKDMEKCQNEPQKSSHF